MINFNLPDDLYRALEDRAAQCGLTVRDLVIQYLQQGLSLPSGRISQKVRLAAPIMIPSSGHVIPPVGREQAAQLEEAEDTSAAVRSIQGSLSRLPVRDPRSADVIIGYDQRGLPD